MRLMAWCLPLLTAVLISGTAPPVFSQSDAPEQTQAAETDAAPPAPEASAAEDAEPTQEPSEATPAQTTDATAGSEEQAEPTAAEEAPATTAATAATGLPAQLKEPGSVLPEPQTFSNGAFVHRIPIETPDFHDIEPNLSLVYSSNQRLRYSGLVQGLTGVGFRLDGIPVIERARRNRGVPAFDSNDVYLLSGQEMVRCSDAARSPSCEVPGGNWTTRIESYQRIRYAGGNNEWIVTRKDGVKYTFRPVADYTTYNNNDLQERQLANDYRWLLATVRDLNGNQVTYDYGCAQVAYCRPTRITYNGYLVRFYYESRPDPFTYATGAGTLRVAQRLQTIETRANNVTRAAYQMIYNDNAPDGVSQLRRIQRFGTNVVITSGGEVVSGTRLPSTVLIQGRQIPAFTQTDTNRDATEPYVVGDVTGDEKDDLVLPKIEQVPDPNGGASGLCNITRVREAIGNSTTYNLLPGGDNEPYCIRYEGSLVAFRMGDLNGDGYSDLIRATYCRQEGPNGTSGTEFALDAYYFDNSGVSSSVRFYSQQTGQLEARACDDPGLFSLAYVTVADINGDGDADVVVPNINKVFVGRAGANPREEEFGTEECANELPNNCNILSLDAFGVGKADILRTEQGQVTRLFQWDSSTSQFVELLNGNNATLPPFVPLSGLAPRPASIADINGDGLDDYIENFVGIGTNDPEVRVYVNTGLGFVAQQWAIEGANANTFNGFAGGLRWVVGEFNGDGRADLGAVAAEWFTTGQPTPARTLLSTGSGFALIEDTDMIVRGFSQAGGTADFNGDGVSDFYGEVGSASNRDIDVVISDTPPQNLANELQLPFGATTTITYEPSSNWDNDPLPSILQTVQQTITDDGRGTQSRINLIYGDGAWNWEERMFLGFRTMTMRLPAIEGEANRPEVEVEFSQDFAAIGRPEAVRRYDSTAALVARTDTTYSGRNGQVPYTALPITVREVLVTGSREAGRQMDYEYDLYGSITEEMERTVPLSAGGVRSLTPTYHRNLDDYLVDRVAVVTYFGGGQPGPNFERRINHYYDGQTTYTNPPTRGNLTRRQVSRDISGSTVTAWLISRFEYDGRGNVLSEYTPLNFRTGYVYDLNRTGSAGGSNS
ncbi:MAG: toxin TcdB middle/N-terminal domain-containing protein [Devosia sp.]